MQALDVGAGQSITASVRPSCASFPWAHNGLHMTDTYVIISILIELVSDNPF